MGVDDLFDQPDDATPLTPSERDGLRPTWVTFRHELNEVEQENIAVGAAWAHRQQKRDLLDSAFVRKLHNKLFGNVWTWAGEFRRSDRNLGVAPHQIAIALRGAIDDTRFWIEQQTFEVDEIAIQFHHRLVVVHPFVNGNGRTSRLMADLVAERLGRSPFTWGRTSLTSASQTRSDYVTALRAADGHNVGPLIRFARS